jgi:hypothetical protein
MGGYRPQVFERFGAAGRMWGGRPVSRGELASAGVRGERSDFGNRRPQSVHFKFTLEPGPAYGYGCVWPEPHEGHAGRGRRSPASSRVTDTSSMNTVPPARTSRSRAQSAFWREVLSSTTKGSTPGVRETGPEICSSAWVSSDSEASIHAVNMTRAPRI